MLHEPIGWTLRVYKVNNSLRKDPQLKIIFDLKETFISSFTLIQLQIFSYKAGKDRAWSFIPCIESPFEISTSIEIGSHREGALFNIHRCHQRFGPNVRIQNVYNVSIVDICAQRDIRSYKNAEKCSNRKRLRLWFSNKYAFDVFPIFHLFY